MAPALTRMHRPAANADVPEKRNLRAALTGTEHGQLDKEAPRTDFGLQIHVSLACRMRTCPEGVSARYILIDGVTQCCSRITEHCRVDMQLQLSSMLASLMPFGVPMSAGMVGVVLLVIENGANGRREVALPDDFV